MTKKTVIQYNIIFAIALLLVSCGADRNIKRGDKFLSLGEYYDAADQYKQAYRRTPPKQRELRGKISQKIALANDKIDQSAKAIAAYRNVIRYKQDDPETHIKLAENLMKQGSYREAAKEYQQALDSVPDNKEAKEGLEAANSAPAEKKEASKYIVKKMDIFNSRRSDYSPMLYGDQFDQLYFTSTRNEAQGDEISGITGVKPGDIFYSEKDDKGHWTRPQTIESGLNTEYDEGTPDFSPDGREMYITQCTTDPSYPRYAQIAVSNRSDASWGKATPLEISRDTLSSFAHPAISPDGKWLYFVSDMPGGKGGLDIWRVRLIGGTTGGVENLGEPINTPGDEEFPTFRPNGDLYFSSNRNDARGWDHIYSFELPEIVQTVKGWVYEMEGYELPAAQVYMVGDDGTNLKLSVKGDGSFEQVIKPGVDYIMLASCKGYLNHKEELKVDSVTESQEYTLQFPLASIRVPVMIDNIFYDFDKATLRPESKKALDELVKLLQDNPNVTIELSAHCDYKGSEAYNKKLSQERANNVVAYLVEHGIAKDRLTPVGYGKSKPKTIRKKLTEKYPWLKENDVLTEDFIKKLDKDKQEICNQLNRRTEFIVLRTTYGMFDDKGNLKNPPKPKPQEDNNSGSDDSFDIDIE